MNTNAETVSFLVALMRFCGIGAVLCLTAAVTTYGQDTFEPRTYENFQSPEAASLGRFGEIPVSLYTGVPDISIPLTAVSSGPLTLPVFLQYHSGGIKANDVASWVGLGWTLNAGGVITRSVRGCADEDAHGYYYQGDRLYTSAWNDPESDNAIMSGYDGPCAQFDYEPDVFFFNFAGRSGTFVMPPKGRFAKPIGVTVPHSKLSIEAVISGSVITSWTVVDEDGIRYIFDKEEISLEFVNQIGPGARQYRDAISWYLTKIESADGLHTIDLTYSAMYDYHYFSRSVVRNDEMNRVYINQPNTRHRVRKLESIESTTHKLVFNAVADRKDAPHIGSASQSLYMKKQGYRLHDIVLSSKHGATVRTMKRWRFHQSYFNDGVDAALSASGHYQKDYAGLDLWKRLRLDSLQVRDAGNAVLQSYTLSYHEPGFNYRKYNRSNNTFSTTGVQVTLPPYLDVAYLDVDYLNHIPFYLPAVDHWGYFNAKFENNIFNIPGLDYPIRPNTGGSSVDRNANETAMKAASLKRINYPTGGYAEFEFEANRYGRIRDSSASPEGIGGGLRIAKITTHDGMGGIPQVKRYQYTTQTNASSGTLIDQPQYLGVYFYEGAAGLCSGPEFEYSDSSLMPLGTTGGAPVGYERITVLYGSSGEGGREVYEFESPGSEPNTYVNSGILTSSSNVHPNGDTVEDVLTQEMEWHLGQLGFHSAYTRYKWGFGYRTDMDHRRGRLLRRTAIGANGLPVEKEVRTYTNFTSPGPISSVRGISVRGYKCYLPKPPSSMTGHGSIGPPIYWIQYEHPVEWSYLHEVETLTYNTDGIATASRKKTYTHSPAHLQVTKVVEAGSDNRSRVTEYEYAHQHYAGMAGLNMLSQPARTDIYQIAGSTKRYESSEVTTWKTYSGKWRPYLEFVWRSDSTSSTRPPFTSSNWSDSSTPGSEWVRTAWYETYHSTNGQPTKVRDASGAITLLYYGDNTDPLSNVASGLGSAYLTGIRSLAGTSTSSSDLIQTAKYDLRWGKPGEITNASGLTTTYSYDTAGRLKTVRMGSVLMSDFAYNLSGSSVGSAPNYVQTRLYGKTDSEYVESTQFFDGLGRPIQTVERGSGSSDKEIVTTTDYDAQGRVLRQWKPYERNRSTTTEAPTFASDYDAKTKAYYSGTMGGTRPFVETQYHADPLGRVQMVLPEGISSESQSVRYSYGVSSLNGKMHTYTQITDEEGRRTRSYSDAMGREVRIIQDYGGIAATTGYEYDIMGRVMFTMPPTFYSPRTEDDSSPYFHRTNYGYDTRGNLRDTMSPDAGMVRHRYDKAGRLRFSQDARQHAGNEAAFTRYDTFSRPVRSGVASVSNFDALDPESITNTFEHTPTNWLSVWHYDTGIAVDQFPWDRVPTSAYSGFYQTNIKGRLSARAYKSDGVWQVELYRYDSEGRITAKRILTEDLPTRQTNYTYVYDRQGRLLERTNQVGSFNAWNYYDYDSYGRLEKIFMKTTYPGKPASPEVTYTYNAAGQKTGERYRGNGLLPFKYTIRGQLYDIGSPRNYAYPIPFSARYIYTPAGNVQYAEFYQRDSPHFFRGYRYAHTYDNLNRLEDAQFAEWAGGSAFYHSGWWRTSNITYDKNGNILTLERRNQSGTLVDDLTYSYGKGRNTVTGVSDAAGATQSWDSGTISFQYDGNGNTTTYHDLTHNHYRTMTYDEFNRVSNYSNHNIQTSTRYRYNADGQRYLKRTNPFMQPSTVEYYAVDGNATIGVFSATGGGTWNIFTPSGEVVGRMTTSGSASYYIKDHLGSVRAVVNSSGTVLETRDYYPFGLEMPGRSYLSGTKAKENYTGHERDAESGMLYAGARFYMPNIGRWTSVDPLAFKNVSDSPYSYVVNNPLLYIDPTGLDSTLYVRMMPGAQLTSEQTAELQSQIETLFGVHEIPMAVEILPTRGGNSELPQIVNLDPTDAMIDLMSPEVIAVLKEKRIMSPGAQGIAPVGSGKGLVNAGVLSGDITATGLANMVIHEGLHAMGSRHSGGLRHHIMSRSHTPSQINKPDQRMRSRDKNVIHKWLSR